MVVRPGPAIGPRTVLATLFPRASSDLSNLAGARLCHCDGRRGGRSRRPIAAITCNFVGIERPRYSRTSAMDDLYRDYILEHYRRPHNFGVLEEPSATFEGANPLCGDRITMQLAVRDGVVEDVRFTGRGCAISQASASLLTDEVKGKPVGDVAGIQAADVLELLGIEISPARLKCAMLSFDSLQHLLADVGAKPLPEKEHA